MKEVATLQNHVGGRRVPPRSGRYLDNLDPARNQLLCRVPRSGVEDVDDAVRAAQAAQPAWARRGVGERAAILGHLAEAVERNLDRLARLESEDTGKPVKLARTLDIPRAARNFRYFSEFLASRTEPEHPMPGYRNRTQRIPIGVVGLITPWNLPLYLLSWKLAPALGLGNAVVAKPSEMTPRTADFLVDLMEEAGLPAGLYNVVHGLGPEAGSALVEHAGVRAVSFTGGTATGAKVAAAAASRVKKLSLELGGKNPTIVFADCDFEAAVKGVARAAFTNQGQVCLCGSRVLVDEAIATRFVDALEQHVASWRIGDPQDEATDLGSLVSLAHRDKVEGYVELARREGATVRGGGRPSLAGALAAGAFLRPCLLTGVRQESRVVQEEIFGPVATVQPFASEREAVALANGVRYGLAATVWTKDAARASRVAEALDTGMVWVNSWLVRELSVPFGGVKDSGVGREGGEWSVDFYSEAKNICTPATT
ncbi:MAG: aldehyde dehydrogenase [Thermoplasmatota archaeon]